jgi:cellulose synthase/poly-beta-1,6-N-acetylglucosamine synthase-like glycosyltransferase
MEVGMDFLNGLLFLLAAPVLAGCGYLALLTLASRRAGAPCPARLPLRFSVIVPAHDEEAGIAETVRNLRALDWPRERFQVIVVADNCSDGTAFRAAVAGARVLVRNDRERRGKGYALAHAFDAVLAEGRADAVVVVDADTVPSPNLLREFAAHLERGDRAVQADYGVANPDASWRTRLMAVALGSFHILRSVARERLGLSCGLRGNGMCFSTSLLREVPHHAFSIVEDVEYGLRLGERGVRIAYAGEAHVYGEMVSSGDAARASAASRCCCEDCGSAMRSSSTWGSTSWCRRYRRWRCWPGQDCC